MPEKGYFIRLHKRVLGLRGKRIKDFGTKQSLIDYVRMNLPPGWYVSITWWDGKVFGTNDLRLDKNKDIFIKGIRSNDYQEYRNYVYAIADSDPLSRRTSASEKKVAREQVKQIRIRSKTPRITPKTPRLRR